jgi:hypothetical protein
MFIMSTQLNDTQNDSERIYTINIENLPKLLVVDIN